MQEVDAERRIQQLRGIQPAAIEKESPVVDRAAEHEGTSHKRERKRRRIAGENDTERDIRYAREDQAIQKPQMTDLQLKQRKTSNAPLMDRRGHIDLFPVDGSRHNAAKNAEVEAEKAKKKKEYEDQYTMRFSNAAGFKQSIGQKPWYQSTGAARDEPLEVTSKNVWGDEDPRRKEREKMRVAADDPMAAMQRGVLQLREVEREREQWQEERDRETRDLADMERLKKRKSKRRREKDDLEGFCLDAPASDDGRGKDHKSSHRHRQRHTHRHRSRSREHSSKRSHQRRNHEYRHEKISRPAHTLGPGWQPGSRQGERRQCARVDS